VTRARNFCRFESLRYCLRDCSQPFRCRTEKQLEDKENHLHWKQEYDPIMGWIQEKSKELEDIDSLESSLVILEEASLKFESLYSEINSYQEKIDNVIREGRDIIKEENGNDFVPSIRSDIRSLENTWEMLREQCAAVQLNIKDQMAMRQVEEQEFMTEWSETRIKIEDWLSNADSQAAVFEVSRSNIIEVEEQVAEHEELVFRLATDEKTINDLLDVGEDLLTKKLKSNENKTKVKSELKDLKKSKMKLNSRLIGQQQSLTSLLNHLTRLESDLFDNWVRNCKDLEEKLRSVGREGESDSYSTIDDARLCIKFEEDHLSEIEALKPEIDEVLKDGNEAIESGQLGKLKRQGVRTSMKSLKELLDSKEQNAIARRKEIEEELGVLLQKLGEQVEDWISKSETFDGWIDSQRKQLEELLTSPEEETTLDKVLEEEIAIKDIQTNADSRSSILEALVKEGSTLKENESFQADHPEEHDTVVEKLGFIQEKWDLLQCDIKDKTNRVVKMVSEMQGQLLSVCNNQINGLADTLNSLGPIADDYETLAKDADDLSELFIMIGQTRANVERFDKYAKELQSSDDLIDSAKIELMEANELLHSRIASIAAGADERKSLLHEKIIDVLTESLVALSDTVGKLETKCDEMSVPDSLQTDELVEKFSSLEDILNRLQACEASLSDIEILGSAADNTMILESGEPEDIYKEIELRREFIRHVQLIAREKKPRIYGLMVYSFLQRFDELNKLLTNIEDGVNDEKGVNQDIQAVLEQMRNNEASIEELEAIQKSGEELTMQVSEITGSQMLSTQDQEELATKNSRFVDHLYEVLTTLKLKKNSIKESFAIVLKEKLNELRDWLEMMKKRRQSYDQIELDNNTIKNQIEEIKLLEAQCDEKRLALDVHHEDEVATLCLDQQTIEEMKEADHDWSHFHDWIEHRKKLLHETQNAWENFRQVEVDLLDYLREIERQVKTWEPINLEDEEAVADRVALLKNLLSGMEDRKDNVQNLQAVSEEVIDLIGDDSQMSRNIKSQVSDIHDCWNTNVRQLIEAISKLNSVKDKLQNLEDGINEIRFWLDDAKSILQFYTPDIPDDIMEDLKPKVEKKCNEEISKRDTLRKVNSLGQELFDDVDGPGHDSINKDLKNLNKDWKEVTTTLEKKRNMKKRPYCCWCYRRWLLKYGYYN